MDEFNEDEADEPSDMQLHLERMSTGMLNYLGAVAVTPGALQGMAPNQLNDFVQACNLAQIFALNAKLFDKRVDTELKRNYFD